MDTIFGWLIPEDLVVDFEKEYLSFESFEESNKWDDYMTYCTPEIRENQLKIIFDSFE